MKAIIEYNKRRERYIEYFKDQLSNLEAILKGEEWIAVSLKT